MKIYRNVAKLSGVDLFYLDTRTDGPVIVCLHGRWGRAETWADFMRRYGGQYRVIAPDQRGHGLSGKPVSRYTGEEMADDIAELLHSLKIDSAVLIGHSMGGKVAAYMTVRHPEYISALALLDKSPAGPAVRSELPLEQIAPVDPVTSGWPLPFSDLAEAERYMRQALETELSCRYFRNSLVESEEGYRMMYSPQAIAANIAYYVDWYHLLPEITCPVLLIRSKDSEAVPDPDWLKMQELLPGCMTFEMSHPDHNVHQSNPEEFYRCLDEFLGRLPGFPRPAAHPSPPAH